MEKKSVNRDELARTLENELQVNRFRDYCPNGLQVEGRTEIRHLVSGVTASLALLERALELGADAVLVHHGYFWRGEDMRLIGHKYKRLAVLLKNDINLFAYHLPLDSHPELGNNAQLARLLNFTPAGRFGDDDIGWLGQVTNTALRTVGDLQNHIAAVLGRTPLLIGDPEQALGQIAWCSGAAHSMLDRAVAAGASVYLSGEISEPTVHLARETGVAYLACGHHATERYGVQALGNWIAQQFGITHQFIDVDNPV